MTGLLFDVRKYSIHDGPGIRTAFFFKGCPLRCSWCHNPEGLSADPELLIRPERCLGDRICGACSSACPQGVARPASSSLPVQPGPVCVRCGTCVDACPSEARQIVGQRMSVEDVLDAAMQDEPFYDESGGGVTFTGGEPFFQPDFLLECLQALSQAGIHTAVDTSGYVRAEIVKAAADLADLFLFDIKHMDDSQHRRWTGVSNRPILENLRRLSGLETSVWVRIPLIPGINDGMDNLEALADRLTEWGFSGTSGSADLRSVQILPYHDSAKGKYALWGLPYPLSEVPVPDGDAVSRAVEVFRRRGIAARVGG